MEDNRIQFITHGQKEMLLLDFSNCGAEEVLRLIEAAKPVIRSRPEQSVLTLTDVTNARFSEKVAEGMKRFTLENKPYVRAAAVVGVTGLKKIIFSAVTVSSHRKIELFDDREEARAWLEKK